MLKKYIFENPEIVRYFRLSFRYPKYIGLTVSYFAFLFIVYFIIYLALNKLSDTYFTLIYVLTIGWEFVMAFYISTYFTSNSFSLEKEKNTLDFIRMSTVDRKAIAIGKLLGPSIFIWFLILLTTPIVFAAFSFTNVPFSHFLIVHIHMFIYSIAFNTIGLFSAVVAPKKSQASGAGIAIAMIMTLVAGTLIRNREENPFYNLFVVMQNKIEYNINFLDFFGFSLPSFVVILVFIGFFVYWFLHSLIRKIDNELSKPFTKKESIVFFTLFQVLILGVLWNQIQFGRSEFIMALMMFNFVVVSFLSAILTPTFDDTVTFINKKQDYAKSLLDPKGKNNFLILILSIIALVFTLIIAIKSSLYLNTSQFFINFTITSIVFILFNYFYSQLMYLCNIIFIKNANTMSAILIAIALFIPIPFGAFGDSRDLGALLLLNPFMVLSLTYLSKNIVDLVNIFEIAFLIIASLGITLFVSSKDQKIIEKHKL